MKKIKNNSILPWLTATGVEIPTEDLKRISKSWDPLTWESYLKWFESGCHEKLVLPTIYDKVGDEQTETLFEQFAQDNSPEKMALVKQILAQLPPLEFTVLRLTFLEGKTEVEIGFILNRSRTGINHIKNRALSRLKRGNRGDELSARQYMKGESFSPLEDEPTIWDEQFQLPLKENRPYDPNNHKAEFAQIKISCVRVALQSLSETAQQMLYLKFWCDFSTNQIARALGCGVNLVQDIESSAIFKVKTRALAFEIGTTPGGDVCA